MKFPGLGFAPWHVPLERRLQTLAVLFHVWTFIFMGFSSLLLLIILMFTPVWYIPLLYLMWYVYDFNQSSRGGRRREWVRKLPLWNWFRDYFPIKLIKTADLDPRYNYIIGGHPHGIMGLGIMSTMLTEAHGFSQLYPGITNVLLSLKLMHYFPFYREYIMAFGICDVSKESISYLMQKDHGVAVTIVVGGAKEAFDANPGQSKLVLKSRKGTTQQNESMYAILRNISTFCRASDCERGLIVHSFPVENRIRQFLCIYCVRNSGSIIA